MRRRRVVIQTGVMVKMRDGVTLRADVFWPDDTGKFPALLEHAIQSHDTGTASELAAHGYVVVIQDICGRLRFGGVGIGIAQ